MTHLVQLVSDQTMPNVLAALALEPAHITLLHTPRTEPQAAWINNALRRAGLVRECRPGVHGCACGTGRIVGSCAARFRPAHVRRGVQTAGP